MALRLLVACVGPALIGAATFPAGTFPQKESSSTLVQRALDRIPVTFEPNHGQAARRDLFVGRAGNNTVSFRRREVVLGTPRATPLKLRLLGAREPRNIEGLSPAGGTSSYFAGNRPSHWLTNIPNFRRVRYEGVYNGIDLVFRGTGGNLEYDFIVSPGADPSRIEMELIGARSIDLTAGGNLHIDGEGFSMTQHKPVVFQERAGVRTEIPGEYVLRRGNRVCFRIGAFDRTQTLVIDPVLVYSTIFGGTTASEGSAIAVDASGDAYIAGSTGYNGLPVIPGSLHTGVFGMSQAYICKLNSTGTSMAYCSTITGTDGGDSRATGIAVDSKGNAYVTGSTSSQDFPTTPGAFQSTGARFNHGFVLRLNASGTALSYSTYLAGDYPDMPQAIAIDSSGNAFVGGVTYSTKFPVTPHAFQRSPVGTRYNNGFVTKVDSTGSSLIYSTYLGGSDVNEVHAIAVDSAGSAYVTGSTWSFDFPVVSGSFQTSYSYQPFGNAFVSKLDPSGSYLVYSTFLKGASSGAGIAVDLSGNAYVAGSGEYFDLGGMRVVGSPGFRYSDIFAVKINPAGSALSYATSMGGSWDDQATGITLDHDGNIWITGWSESIDFPQSSPVQAISGTLDAVAEEAEVRNALIIKLDSEGAPLFSTYLGGRNNGDTANAVAVDSTGTAYVIGRAGSADFPVTSGVVGDSSGHGFNFFVAAFGDRQSCTYSLSAVSDAFGSAGGEHSVTVTAPDGCNWIAAANQSWLPINGGMAYLATGSGSVRYSAPANVSNPRTATLSIAGIPFSVSQAGGCTYSLSSSSANVLAEGGRVTVHLTTGPYCPWNISNMPDWIAGAYGAAMLGGYAIVLDVQPGPSRTGSFTIAGLPFAVNQGEDVNCTYTIDKVNGSYPASGFEDNIGVSTGSGCAWNAYSTSTWLRIDRLTSSFPTNDLVGVGTGSFFVTADQNFSSTARTAIVVIGTQKFIAVQAPMYTGLAFYPITPCRVADTRNTPNSPFAGPSIAAGTSRDFAIPDGPCGVPASAQAYSLNVGVVPQGRLGFLTVWPAGQRRPTVSTLNSWDGRVKSNGAIIPAGAGSAISVFASDTTHVVLDINGYFVPAAGNPAAMAYYPLPPCRVLDTRDANGPLGGPYLGGNTSRDFPVLSASSCGISSTAQAYSLNVAVVPRTSMMHWLTAWPTGQPQPVVATLNDRTGTVLSNGAIVPAGSGGQISIYAADDTELVIDINGYFAPQGAGGLLLYTLNPCRVLDTRLLPPGAPPFSGTLNVMLGVGSCGLPETANAYAFNATVVPPGVMHYMTLWPQGTTQPLASSLNDKDGTATSNMALVPSNNRLISAFVTDPTHLILDIFGYFAP
jgi:hypothetical protein